MDDIYGNREYEGCETVVIFLNGLHEGLLDFISQIPAKLEQDFYEILPGPAMVYKDFTFALHKKVEKD